MITYNLMYPENHCLLLPELWADSYEKALLMSKEGADEKVIKLALSWDKCFKENPSNLKESLENYYDIISENLQDDKRVIDEDYQERESVPSQTNL